jgi:ASCH domain
MFMKALSVRQPWAWLIVNGFKPIENRDWSTTFRGQLLIHASKGMTKFEYEDCADLVGAICGKTGETISLPAFFDLERGGIVGAAEVSDCVEDSSSYWFSGKFGLVMRNAKPLPFRILKGKLGFFDVPASYAEAA